MKINTFKIVLTLAALCAMVSGVKAQFPGFSPNYTTAGLTYFSQGGQTNGVDAKTSWVVVPPNAVNGGVAVVNYLQWSSDLLSANATAYYTTNACTVNKTNYTTLTTIPVDSTNGFPSVADCVVFLHAQTGVYERRLTTATGSFGTNLALTYALSYGPAQPGDIIYLMKTNAQVYLGVGTNAITGDTLCGQQGKPLLVETTGTAAGAAKINLLSARYASPYTLFRQSNP